MIAALGTLVFLATLWLLIAVGAAILEENGARMVTALKGYSPAFAPIHLAAGRFRPRARMRQPMRARSTWRDAA